MGAVYSGRGVEICREHPILFSGPMVVAILDGRKTVTRRLIRVHDQRDDFERQGAFYGGLDNPRFWTFNPRWDDQLDGKGDPRPRYAVPCPYGAPGDRLWVRESWGMRDATTGERWVAGNTLGRLPTGGRVDYRADGEAPEAGWWKPSIHMPRWASRITLEVVSVRVERLQDITAEDVQAEGVQLPVSTDDAPKGKVWPLIRIPNPYEKLPKDWTEDDFWRCEFACTWEAINGKRSPWRRNDWVWRVEFRRIA